MEAGIATGVGTNLATNENNINLESAELGRNNFFTAEGGLSGVAGLENPNPTAGAATSAGGQAFGEANSIQNQKNQEEADIAGSVSSMALAGLSGGASGFANLDTTGGSTTGEQFQNFFSGAFGG